MIQLPWRCVKVHGEDITVEEWSYNIGEGAESKSMLLSLVDGAVFVMKVTRRDILGCTYLSRDALKLTPEHK
jgi:hypothetical protein